MNAIVVVPVQPARPAPRPGAQHDRARSPDADRQRPRGERRPPPSGRLPEPIPEILPADTLDDLSPSATVGHIVDTFALPAGSFGGSPMHGRTRCW